jgi:CDP-diacylglycerol---glycerol-3-phosphate 3-phosphatidyltransferase
VSVRSQPAPPSNWNLANGLTTLRIVLVPLLAWLLLSEGGDDYATRWWATVVFTAAILTDRVDGELARRRNVVTDFGKVMDPIADKALTGMAFVGLSVIGELWWWVTVVVLGREWGITLLRFWVMKYGVIPASRGGKIKTAVQGFALGGLIAPLHMFTGPWDTLGNVLWWVSAALMAAAVVITLVTGLDYVREAARVRRAGQDRERMSA